MANTVLVAQEKPLPFALCQIAANPKVPLFIQNAQFALSCPSGQTSPTSIWELPSCFGQCPGRPSPIDRFAHLLPTGPRAPWHTVFPFRFPLLDHFAAKNDGCHKSQGGSRRKHRHHEHRIWVSFCDRGSCFHVLYL